MNKRLKMNIRILIITLFCLAVFSSCGSDDDLTSGLLIVKELKTIISKNDIFVFDIRTTERSGQGEGRTFVGSINDPVHVFKGELLCFDDRCYNVNQITEFYISVYQAPDDSDPDMLVIILAQ